MVPQLVRARGTYQGLLQQTHGARAHANSPPPPPHSHTPALQRHVSLVIGWWRRGDNNLLKNETSVFRREEVDFQF